MWGLHKRTESSFLATFFVGLTILLIDMPYYAIIFIPMTLVLGVVCFLLLLLLARFDLNNFWIYQTLPTLIVWPLAYSNLPYIGYTNNEQLTHISFAVLALVHLGTLIFWVVGVFHNAKEFPTVTAKFPLSAFTLVPIITWLTYGALETTA